MTLILVKDLVIETGPELYTEGHVLTPIEAQMLNLLWLQRLTSKLGYWESKNETKAKAETKAEVETETPVQASTHISDSDLITLVQAKAKDITNQLLSSGLSPTAADPVEIKAIELAREMIKAQLANENLPVPPGIDDHAKALAKSSESIQLKAKVLVEAQLRTSAERIKRWTETNGGATVNS